MSVQHETLDRLVPGTQAIVEEVDADDTDGARLKRMGICRGRRIELVKSGSPMIVRVVGTRVGLSATLARHVRVSPCESDLAGEDRV